MKPATPVITHVLGASTSLSIRRRYASEFTNVRTSERDLPRIVRRTQPMLMSLLVRVSGCGQGIFHSLHETLRSYFKLLYHRYLEQAESGDWTVWVGGVSHDHPS